MSGKLTLVVSGPERAGATVGAGLSVKLLQWLKKCRLLRAAKGVAPRALTQADLGIKGALQELKGTFAVKDGVANARVDMIRGDIKNPFEIIKNLSETAKAQGATTLKIEATLANEQLYNILAKRYGLVTEGSKEIITIPLK